MKFCQAARLAILLLASCGPAHSAVRAIDRGEDAGEGGAGGEGGGGGTGGTRDGPGGQGGRDAAAEAGPERPVDAPPEAPADRPPDLPSPDTREVGVGEGKTVLMVVGFLDALFKPGDTKLKARLESRGFTVKIGDDDLGADQAMGANLVIITHTSGPQVAGKYTNLALPVIAMEEALFDDLRLTANAGGDHGLSDVTQVAITMAGHPLAGGLTGMVTVAGSSLPASWGQPAAAAIRVATVPGQANQVAVFGYTQGAAMAGGMNAPAKRVGLFITENLANVLNDQSGRLFDGAVDWALQ
jgi:hypothetical protein